MVRQYRAIKAHHPDAILFYRMGDFYEMFFEDAERAAPLLQVALTARRPGKGQDPIPMCGVPHHAADTYIARLLKAGCSVAICEQVEDPKLAKGLVKRDVVRVVTPGTVLAAGMLETPTNNFLAAVYVSDGRAGVAFIDISTGDFIATELSDDDPLAAALEELERMGAVEALYPADDPDADPPAWTTRAPNVLWRPRADWRFAADHAAETITRHFGLHTTAGLGLDAHPAALQAAGAVLDFVTDTQRQALPHLKHLRPYFHRDRMALDAATVRNLELFETVRDKRVEGSLWGVLNTTITALGARALRDWVQRPLTQLPEIEARAAAGEAFGGDHERRGALRARLKHGADMERVLGRLAAGTGNARDAVALRRSLAAVPDLKQQLHPCAASLLVELHALLDPVPDLADTLERGIVDEPAATLTDGNMIRPGFDPELDRLRVLVGDGREWIATLQRSEAERTGIPNLKIGFNKVFGYFIEVTKANAARVPEDYQRKQTLVNAERYVTPELKSREEDILGAQERMASLEYNLFQRIREEVCAHVAPIQQTAAAVGALDAVLALADVAARRGYVRPEMHDVPGVHIEAGRHPVIETMLDERGFVPNDTALGRDRKIALITGPNMAGKSTYLRQTALIVLLAQIGSFVPAARATIGVVDRIFTRVGASDNLVRGESTFMVEMIEAANILAHATERSLIVFDEIGRGTSTYDGISIAWAVVEFVHDRIGALTLFATHYHELAALAGRFAGVFNLTVAVREWSGHVVFLYQIVDGSADHSYGIHVAQLAGLPRAVVERARAVMAQLEQHGETAKPIADDGQMHLFAGAPPPSAALEALRRIDPDNLSPREALDVLFALKRTLDSEPPSG